MVINGTIGGNCTQSDGWLSADVREAYKTFHYWFATVWCSLTSVGNIVTIVVLQHKTMRNTTNTLLTGVAAMHLVISLMYIPLAQIVLTFQRTRSDSGSYWLASCMLLTVLSIVTAQMCSIWMTVSVAVFRYIYIRFPQHSAQLCTTRSAAYTVLCVIIFSQLLSIPAWLAHYVELRASTTCHLNPDGSENHTVVDGGYTVSLYMNGTVTAASIWINSQCGKFIPSLILCILSVLLVRTMKIADKRRQLLVGGGDRRTFRSSTNDSLACRKSERKGKNGTSVDKGDRERRTNRTTKLLLAVAAMFIISNLPQSALEMMAAFNSFFRMHVYPIIGDLMDTVAQLNNGITFVIYCTMSAQFRCTFRDIFVDPLFRVLGLAKLPDEKIPKSDSRTKVEPTQIRIELIQSDQNATHI